MILDLLKQCLRNLKRQKGRSILTVLSISIGVASVILTSSIGVTGKTVINQEMNQMGIDGVLIGKESSSSKITFGQEQLETIRTQKDVLEAFPIVTSFSQIKMRDYIAKSLVWGIDEGAKQVISLSPVYGRMIRKGDIDSHRNVCLVDINTAKAFYHRDNIVGKTLRILVDGTYHSFEVIGVVNSGGNLLQSLAGSYIPTFVYLPYTTMQDIMGKQDFDQIAVKLSPGIDMEKASNTLLASLMTQTGQAGYSLENMSQHREQLDQIIAAVTIIISAVAAISLVVAGLGIMTIMLISVNERTREIGIKKSVGANKRMIMKEFLIEAAMLSCIGGILGAGGGIAAIYIGGFILNVPITIHGTAVILTIVLTVFLGIIFGVYPSMKAAQMMPVDSFRKE